MKEASGFETVQVSYKLARVRHEFPTTFVLISCRGILRSS